MKRFVVSLFVMTMLIVAIAIPASGASYVRTFNYEFVDPYTTSTTDGNGAVVFSFSPLIFYNGPIATTDIQIPSGCRGRVFTFIASGTAEARSSESNDVINGFVSCSARIEYSGFASKTVHYANRTVDGVMSYWEYTYVSASHQTSAQEVAILESIKHEIQ